METKKDFLYYYLLRFLRQRYNKFFTKNKKITKKVKKMTKAYQPEEWLSDRIASLQPGTVAFVECNSNDELKRMNAQTHIALRRKGLLKASTETIKLSDGRLILWATIKDI